MVAKVSLYLAIALQFLALATHGFTSVKNEVHPHSQISTSLSSSYLDNLSTGESSFTPEPPAFEPPSTYLEGPVAGFESVSILSLEQADSIANYAINCCKRNGFNPVTVFVLDAWGSTLVSKRMDGCSPVGIPDFAKAKAYSCVVNKYPSRAFRDRYTQGVDPAKFCQMTGMVAISQGQMAPFPGGILITLGDEIVGAVGVSGAAGDEDEYCAIRGVVESGLGLSTIPAEPSCATIKD